MTRQIPFMLIAKVLILSLVSGARAQEPVESANRPAVILLSDPGQRAPGKTLSSARAVSSRPPAPATAPVSPLFVTPVIAPQIQFPATAGTGLNPSGTPKLPVAPLRAPPSN